MEQMNCTKIRLPRVFCAATVILPVRFKIAFLPDSQLSSCHCSSPVMFRIALLTFVWYTPLGVVVASPFVAIANSTLNKTDLGAIGGHTGSVSYSKCGIMREQSRT